MARVIHVTDPNTMVPHDFARRLPRVVGTIGSDVRRGVFHSLILRMEPMSGLLRSSGLVAAAVAVLSVPSLAQSTLGEQRRQSTRTELEEQAKAAQEAAAAARDPKLRAKHQEDAEIRLQRLKNGDFAPGDRILLQVYGDSVLTDTVTVRADRKLHLPNIPIPDIPLQGVLDSELEAHLTKALGVYIKEVRVQATALVNLGVLGAVVKSGFLTVPADQALTDVITAAGGLSGQADLDRTFVKRGPQTVIDPKSFQDALRRGKTVGDVSMRDGDQIIVPDKTSRFSATQVFGALGAVASLFWAVRVVGRGR
jgi:protein involved in polysaccharide export with SLBB domain